MKEYRDLEFLAGTWMAEDYAEFVCSLAEQRKEIAEEAQQSLSAFRAGAYKVQSASEAIMELRNSLDEKDE
ncbi:MAG: hypothetical protein H6654_10255 [Ardenticatenaceae bacterium]|nr:hypothetical protein [Anaerolineales bacterium]MCB8938694.1 hypothetical protein [Ardenticatenaceae bacterium]MCB8973930.1 hypothetical protein [Ardenticatenaceae bacterium]